MSFLVSRSSGVGGVSRSASSPAVKRTLSGMEKDLSEGTSTSHTASETDFNDASEIMGASDHTLGFNNASGKGDGLDASRHGMEDSSTKKQGPPSKRGSGMMRGMWSSMRSFRTNTRRASLESKDGNAGMDESLHNGSVHGAPGVSGSVHSPKLPKRQATFETARGSTVGGDAAADQMSLAGSFANLEIDCGDLTIQEGSAAGAGPNEETVELQEKIEALERKLETKQAVLQSLLPSADSENDEDRLKLKIQEQALRIEALEEEQYRRDSMMEEEQQQQQQMDLQQNSSQSSVQYWEQIQEQQETITRMESDHQYQMQMFTKREKQLQEMLAQAQAEKQKLLEQHEQQLEELQSQLTQAQEDAEGYRTQANDLREMVNDMEQTNEEQIHLLRIAMSSIEDSLGEQF